MVSEAFGDDTCNMRKRADGWRARLIPATSHPSQLPKVYQMETSVWATSYTAQVPSPPLAMLALAGLVNHSQRQQRSRTRGMTPSAIRSRRYIVP